MRLVAVSGWGQEEYRRRAREAGFDQHLTQPADRAALESILAEEPPTPSSADYEPSTSRARVAEETGKPRH